MEEDSSYYRHSKSNSRNLNPSANMHTRNMQISMPMHLEQPTWHGHSKQSQSVNTISTVSSGGSNGASSDYIQRSISSRSNSYVALLRKQKATVWCDQAQYIDPVTRNRNMLERRDAHRQLNKSAGSASGPSVSAGGRTSTSLSKVRHQGKDTDQNYFGVPMRLSATEVDGGDSDGDEPGSNLHHRRTGSSGRSSIGSGRRGLYRTSGGGGMGSQSSRRRSPGHTPERAGSLAEERAEDLAGGTPPPSDETAFVVRVDEAARTERATDDAARMERADNASLDEEADDDVGELDVLNKATKSMHSKANREKGGNSVEDLKRRGSVDERSITLTKGRLFIANPD